MAPPAWVPTSDPEDIGPPLQEFRASLPQELHLFISLELFPSPVLTASPSWPIEGSPMTLTCETWLPPQTSHTRLQFCFFKEHQALGAGWSNSPELQIPTTWSEGAASYWCQARTVIPRILKTSPRSQIRVHSECLGGRSCPLGSRTCLRVTARHPAILFSCAWHWPNFPAAFSSL